MATLALAGLGASSAEIERHARAYERRLERQHTGFPAIDGRSYHAALGTLAAYPAFVDYFDREIAHHGAAEALRRHLPELASGWVRDAYHALIRLGYGIEFDAPSEIAAGLAYLAAIGPDERLASAARSGATHPEPLAAVRARPDASFVRGGFSERYDAVMKTSAVAESMPVLTDALRRVAHASIRVFEATHGFFALHLVTASHAMRVCAPYIGPSADGLSWAGLLAGYSCIGAPAPRKDAAVPRCAAPDVALRDNEHLIKLAYSAQSQAKAFDDPTFTRIVAEYLDGADPRRLA
jgi:hypothetical protein